MGRGDLLDMDMVVDKTCMGYVLDARALLSLMHSRSYTRTKVVVGGGEVSGLGSDAEMLPCTYQRPTGAAGADWRR